MQKSNECDVATHIGPESCGAAREGGIEALTRERAGRVFSPVRNLLRDADAVGESGRPHRVHPYRPEDANREKECSTQRCQARILRARNDYPPREQS
jgi:hypothetical protein